jgi:hypothetical protein
MCGGHMEAVRIVTLRIHLREDERGREGCAHRCFCPKNGGSRGCRQTGRWRTGPFVTLFAWKDGRNGVRAHKHCEERKGHR